LSANFFLDTNVLVYCFDARFPDKQARARGLVREALTGAGAISFQVVQEFLNVALRRFAEPLTIEQAREVLDRVLLPMCRVSQDADLYRDALAVQQRWGFHFFDALIVASAQAGGCRLLYTEDLQHGQILGGLRVVDPFR
jgi:predicted nucleic acid-binding protein